MNELNIQIDPPYPFSLTSTFIASLTHCPYLMIKDREEKVLKYTYDNVISLYVYIT